jgi:hypothetical protein
MPASEDKIPPLDEVPEDGVPADGVGVEPAFPKMPPKSPPPLLGEAEAGVGD